MARVVVIAVVDVVGVVGVVAWSPLRRTNRPRNQKRTARSKLTRL
jgi:hypothetical protein